MQINISMLLILLVAISNVTPNQCIPPGSTVECSGLGSCIEGVCECNKRTENNEIITGKFCECVNNRCDQNKRELCNGLYNGVCICGECECTPGFGGFACQCPTTTKSCIIPKDVGSETEILCSGRGKCICGECICASEPRSYGRYCENTI